MRKEASVERAALREIAAYCRRFRLQAIPGFSVDLRHIEKVARDALKQKGKR